MIRYFNYAREEAQNPYTGFMSFQHFRGEKMYSDIVVRPEANYTETERVECYPPSPDAEENGREEGYYPDTSIVYIRILWKEFEPERGVYNYKFIDDILDNARSHNQTLIFRLMAHSTRACDDVPEWLKSIVDCPLRPDGERVKDSPTDPRFLDYFLEAVEKIGERYDEDPVFDAIDISLPGAWGEGHNLHLYPENTLERIVDVYTASFKNTQLFAQAARPNLIRYGEKSCPIGWRGDGFGHPRHMDELYPPCIEEIKDVWKSAPVSFESYWWMCEWQRRGWDIDKIIEKSLEWHLSSFNPKSMPAPMEWKDKIDSWVSRMGYHFAIDYVKYPEFLSAGDEAEIEIMINNTGVAPIYKNIPMYLKLFGCGGEILFKSGVDIRTFMPGKTSVKIKIEIPKDFKKGEYTLGAGIMNDLIPLIYFATDAKRCGSFYILADIKII